MSKQDLREIPEEYYPTPKQKELFWQFLDLGKPVTPDGWWRGWCPLHDPIGSSRRQTTAHFHFRHGVMRCLKPDTDCTDLNKTGKRRKNAISLQNLQLKMAANVSQRA